MTHARGNRPERQLILRDYLAAARTVMANERTLLAYVRTTLALLACGASLIQFFTHPWMRMAGWVFIPAGVLTAVIGTSRYLSMRRSLRRAVGDAPDWLQGGGEPDASD